MTPRKCNCYNEPGLCDFCLAALRTRLAESEAEVGRLTRSCDGWQEDARLYARNAADWEAKCHAAEAERDDLLGALRGLMSDTEVYHSEDPDCSICHGWLPDDHTPGCSLSRARAAIAKVGK